jgi:hypothetical protein
MEEKRKNALEMGKEKEKKAQARTEEESRRTLSRGEFPAASDLSFPYFVILFSIG